MVDADVQDEISIWKFRQWCLRHKLHLITKRQLVRKPTYFGSIAKIANTWRSGTNPKTIFDAWSATTNLNDAKKYVGRLMPVPLKGRWQAITRSEQYLLFCGIELLPTIWRDALVTSTLGAWLEDPAAPVPAQFDVIDETMEDLYVITVITRIMPHTQTYHN